MSLKDEAWEIYSRIKQLIHDMDFFREKNNINSSRFDMAQNNLRNAEWEFRDYVHGDLERDSRPVPNVPIARSPGVYFKRLEDKGKD